MKTEKKSKKTEWVTNSNDFNRKYRSRSISEVVGQDVIKYTMRGWVKRKQIPGAIMIHGQLGSGKTTFSRLIAAILNCADLSENGDPCLKCPSCLGIYNDKDQISNTDYLEIDAGQSTGIDGVRALKERSSYKPRNNRLVITLDEAQSLSPAAQNGLLKNLENAQNHVTYILCTTEPHKIIETLAGRCAKLRIAELTTEQNVKNLQRVCKSEGLKLPTEMLEMICSKSNNVPRECLIMLQAVASIMASGEVDVKNITPDALEAKLSTILGVPNYVSIQQYLTGIYSGRIVQALSALTGIASKPMFLKGCIDAHGNMILATASKTPEKLISERWVLGYTKKMISESSIERSQETSKAFAALMNDLVEAYTQMSQYQLGDSLALLSAICAKWCSRFKGDQR